MEETVKILLGDSEFAFYFNYIATLFMKFTPVIFLTHALFAILRDASED